MIAKEHVCGIHAVRHALEADPRGELWLDTERPELDALRVLAEQRKIPVRLVGTRRIRRELGHGELHQGALLIRERGPEPQLAALLERLPPDCLLLALDGVQDPHNLGACLRTLAAAGGHGLIVPRHRAAGLTPAVRKVASGAAEHIPLYRYNLAQALRRLGDAGVAVIGLAPDAGQSLYRVPLTGPLLLVVGAEGRGLRPLTRKHCSHVAHIPQRGAVESLNVATAAAIALFEILRQRGA